MAISGRIINVLSLQKKNLKHTIGIRWMMRKVKNTLFIFLVLAGTAMSEDVRVMSVTASYFILPENPNILQLLSATQKINLSDPSKPFISPQTVKSLKGFQYSFPSTVYLSKEAFVFRVETINPVIQFMDKTLPPEKAVDFSNKVIGIMNSKQHYKKVINSESGTLIEERIYENGRGGKGLSHLHDLEWALWTFYQIPQVIKDYESIKSRKEGYTEHQMSSKSVIRVYDDRYELIAGEWDNLEDYQLYRFKTIQEQKIPIFFQVIRQEEAFQMHFVSDSEFTNPNLKSFFLFPELNTSK